MVGRAEQQELEELKSLCRKLEGELERGREMGRGFLLQVIDINPHFVFAKDRAGRFTLVNRALADAYGTTQENLLGRTDADFNPDAEEVAHFRRDDLEVMDTLREKVIAEEKITDAAGRVRWLHTIKRPLLDADGSANQVLGVATDITRHKELEERLSHAALHDTLTNLPNRALFRDRLELAHRRSRRAGAPRFAVLFLDLDRFKRVNDSLGHGSGDELLRAVARRLGRAIRPADTVARLGGDEFTILVNDVVSPSDPLRVAERIHRELTSPIEIGCAEVFVSASIGIALSDASHDEVDDLLRDADTAMYRAKALGPGRHVLFDPEMHREAVTQLEIESELRRGIERGEFELWFQPIVRLSDRAVVAREALLRWRHPQRGLLAPHSFLRTAEETGSIIALDELALRGACREAARWRAAGDAAEASVNLYSRQLLRDELPEMLKRIVTEFELTPDCLRLEITEGAFLGHHEAARRVSERIKSLGVRIDLDDFGTGYSSLSYLQRLPLDRIKIDRSFLAPLDHGGNPAIVSAVIQLAHGLGIEVVAEGVETDEQLAKLVELGCDFAQGHLFAPAGPPR